MRVRALIIAITMAVAVWILWPSPHPRAGRIPVTAQVEGRKSASARSDTGSTVIPLQRSRATDRNVLLHDASGGPRRVFAPLPPTNTQLRLVYSQLKEQARAGDVHAQCRLAFELKRCADAPKLAKFAADLAADPTHVSAEDLQRIQTRAEHAASVCKDFTPNADDEVWRYTLQAALGGNDGAAVNFALGMTAGLSLQRPLQTLEGWIAYQQYAGLVLQRAIDDGYPPAYSAAATLSFAPHFGAAILPTDHVRTAAYSLALSSIATPEARASIQAGVQGLQLSDADMARASMLAAQLSTKLKPSPDRPFGEARDIPQLLGEDGSWCND